MIEMVLTASGKYRASVELVNLDKENAGSYTQISGYGESHQEAKANLRIEIQMLIQKLKDI